jgi:hypothetical protein
MPLKCTRWPGRLAPTAPAVRLHKAAHAEIPKHSRHRNRDQKLHVRLMIRCRIKDGPPQPPCSTSSKQGEYPEENPGQLQPKRAGRLRQRPPHRLAKAPASFLQPLLALHHLCRRSRNLLSQPHSGRLRLPRRSTRRRTSRSRSRLRSLLRLRSRRRIRRRRCIHSRHQCLGRSTSPDTKRTTESNRIHTPKCSCSHHTRDSLPN